MAAFCSITTHSDKLIRFIQRGTKSEMGYVSETYKTLV